MEGRGETMGIREEKIKVEGNLVEINGFDSKTKEEFYSKMERFIRILPEEEYWKTINSGGGLATYNVTIKFLHNRNEPKIIGKGLEDITIAVNKDRFKGLEQTVMQAAIRHELAELWLLGKAGFSAADLASHGTVTAGQAVAIAHRYARREEFDYAFEHGFGELSLEMHRKREAPDLADSEKAYREALANFQKKHPQTGVKK